MKNAVILLMILLQISVVAAFVQVVRPVMMKIENFKNDVEGYGDFFHYKMIFPKTIPRYVYTIKS